MASGVEAFSKLKVSDVVEKLSPGPLISIKPDTPIREAFETLCKNHIHCVPILTSEESSGKQVCLGLLDLRDFVTYLVEMCSDEGSLLKEDSAISLVNYSKANNMRPVRVGALLTEALSTFAKEKSLHRVPIVTDDSKEGSPEVLHMLSHSTLLQFFVTQKDELLKEFWSTKLSDFPDLAFKKVVYTVSTTDTLLDALKKFLSVGVNAFPIVTATVGDSESGKLLGSISVSDVQYGVLANLDNLREPLSSFLVEASRNASHLYGDEHRIRLSDSPVVAALDETVGSIITKLVDHRISHIWTVDESNIPIGVLTCYDIIEALASFSLAQVLTEF